MSKRFEFIPISAAIPLAERKGWLDGPFCECDDADCKSHLPNEAWDYCGQDGQGVALPGHEPEGVRIVDKKGYVIYEEED